MASRECWKVLRSRKGLICLFAVVFCLLVWGSMVACLRKVEDCTHCLPQGPCLPPCVCQMTALASQVLVILGKGKLMDTGTDSVCLSGEILDAARNCSHSFWKWSGLRPLPSPLPLTGSTGPFGSRCSLAAVFRGIRCVSGGRFLFWLLV